MRLYDIRLLNGGRKNFRRFDIDSIKPMSIRFVLLTGSHTISETNGKDCTIFGFSITIENGSRTNDCMKLGCSIESWDGRDSEQLVVSGGVRAASSDVVRSVAQHAAMLGETGVVFGELFALSEYVPRCANRGAIPRCFPTVVVSMLPDRVTLGVCKPIGAIAGVVGVILFANWAELVVTGDRDAVIKLDSFGEWRVDPAVEGKPRLVSLGIAGESENREDAVCDWEVNDLGARRWGETEVRVAPWKRGGVGRVSTVVHAG